MPLAFLIAYGAWGIERETDQHSATKRMSIDIVTYADEHFDGVSSLWQEAFPSDPAWNHAAVAIPAKFAFQPNLVIVALDGAQVVGSIMAGYDGHRGWINRIAVRRSHRRRHVGAALMHETEARLHAIGCIKINLQVRSDNAAVVEFYRRLGYSIEERVSMAKPLGAFASTA